MILNQQRQEFSTENQFSFANPISLDPLKHAVKADTVDDLKPDAWTRRASLNYDERKLIRLPIPSEGDDSSSTSPPYWKNMGYLMTRSADSSPMHKQSYMENQLGPTSRAQEIARYRQEMLDFVREMPESAYELSLRDMVEVPRLAKTVQETIDKRREEAKGKVKKAKDKSKGMRKLSRAESVETGLFLKLFLPISLGGGRRKSFGGSNSCAKVSPKPALPEAEKGGLENMEGECWKKNESGSTGSSSSNKSNSNSSSRSSRRKTIGCYAFFQTNKSRSKEI
ncbi:hypothetical protein Cni_G11091 [Canna indica]|uniref:Uncharacterized protein n=1 Tax=Canna indica TaxID=4628 RepID=A0AAQ3K9J2_9LILI|nr:hypothetical protein Cni_G11091 [Canna indica]